MEQTAAPTILIVEDEPLIRLMGTLVLSDAGFNVIEACNSEEALRLLEVAPKIDIVFTDVEMPGALDGLGLARCVHERWPGIGVIVTSGRYDLRQGQSATGDLFIAKPYMTGALIHQIEACLSMTLAA